MNVLELEVVHVEGEEAEAEAYNFERPTGDKVTGRHVALLVEMLFITLSVMYVEMAIVPALPNIPRQWPKDAAWAPWVLSAYNIVGAVWTPIAGSLGDIFGPKIPALGSLALYAVGQVGCALANDIATLIVFRGMQGFGMGTFVLCFTIVKATFPPRIVPMSIGFISAMFSIGVSVGIVGGAATMEALPNWQMVFWTTFPVVVLLGIAFAITMPQNIVPKVPPQPQQQQQQQQQRRNKRRGVDWIGALLLTVGVVMLLVGLTLSETYGWKHAAPATLVAIGPVVLVVFVLVELRIRDPLVPVRLMATRDMFANTLLSFFTGFVMIATFQTVPYLLRSAENNVLAPDQKTMLNVGLVMLPYGVIQIILAPPTAAAGKRTGFSLLSTLFISLMCLATGLMTKFHHSLAQLLPILVVYGAGVGSEMVCINNIIAELSSRSNFGALTSANTLCRIVGMAIGPVVANLIMNTRTRAEPIYALVSASSGSGSGVLVPVGTTEVVTDEGYSLAFLASAVFAAAGIVSSLFISGKFKLCRKSSETEKMATSPTPASTPSASPSP